MKRMRKGQTRDGSAARRQLEYDVILRQVKTRKAAFAARLIRNLRKRGDCMLYQGTLDHNGYPRINFRAAGGRHVTIHACRVFAILRNCAPLPEGYEASHRPECGHRRCVSHVFPQHYSINARTAGPDVGVPF